METTEIEAENDKVLIRPFRRRSEPEISPDALMVMIPSELEYLLNINKGKDIRRINSGFFQINLISEKSGKNTSISGPFMGAPQAVMGMEKLIALGAERIWVHGWCGSLQPNLHTGDLFIPLKALSEEGTSLHYPIKDNNPGTSPYLNSMIEKSLEKKGKICHKGDVWTTDAPYRETAGKVSKYRDEGIMAVEMEMSALITLSIYRNVELAGLLIVSDELFDLKWKPGFSDPVLKKSSRFAGKILLDIILSDTES
jgi:purine-nucleoside phosphorylase